MEQYCPSTHIYNWIMSDHPLYLRFKDLVSLIRREPQRVECIEQTAYNLCADAARIMWKCGEFEDEYLNDIAIYRAASTIILDDAKKVASTENIS